MMISTQSEVAKRNSAWPLAFGAVVFIGALLLFQVQLIISKYILPWFGGSAAVWTTCVLVFQILLLLGYSYTHWTSRVAAGIRQKLHIGLLLVSVMILAVTAIVWPSPITLNVTRVFWPGEPTVSVLLVLLLSVGLPFFVLSTTSPLLQQWYWQSERQQPYRLYALSNLGSLIGLLSYPFLFEPRMSVIRQAWIWSGLYTIFVVGTVALSIRMVRLTPPVIPERAKRGHRSAASSQPARRTILLWLLLAACGSSAMLSITNYLTQDIASVPLLWVLPLSIYLVSFIITFDSEHAYRRAVVFPGVSLSLAAICYVLAKAVTESIWIEVAVLNVALLFVTTLCHGELSRSKPAPEVLTRFYLWVAAGGVLGSTFAGLIAPHLFPGLWELPITIVAAPALALIAALRDAESWPRIASPWKVALAAAFVGIAPLMVSAHVIGFVDEAKNYIDVALLLAIVAISGFLYWKEQRSRSTPERGIALASWFAIPVLLAIVLAQLPSQFGPMTVISRSRNFYSVLTVLRITQSSQIGPLRRLYHGRILHGLQAERPEFSSRPTTYYGNFSGVGLALLRHPRLTNPEPQKRDLRVGVVGMGVATILAYGRAGDYFRVYELNPAVVDLSRGDRPVFTNLRDCQAKCDVVVGDARLLLQQEADAHNEQRFDVLALDAFSGDAIPVHLLTREAFELYLKHLRDDASIIAVHISSRALNLAPVVARIASELGLHATQIESPARGEIVRPAVWMLVSRHEKPLELPRWALQGDTVTELPGTGPLWTDDFSDLLSVIRWQ